MWLKRLGKLEEDNYVGKLNAGVDIYVEHNEGIDSIPSSIVNDRHSP